MGEIRPVRPVLLLLAAFGADPRALDWARRRAVGQWGPLALESPVFDFRETDYYRPTMGERLRKVFFAFQQTIDPGRLAAIKVETNQWEDEYRQDESRQDGSCKDGSEAGRPPGVERPLNLDPGYLTEAKLVLASTKDHAHRIYLGGGIFGEVTLRFRGGRWQPWEWTYPDYRRADYRQFFSDCRGYLRSQAKPRDLR